jgi:hypothetical protein
MQQGRKCYKSLLFNTKEITYLVFEASGMVPAQFGTFLVRYKIRREPNFACGVQEGEDARNLTSLRVPRQ